MNFLYYLHWRNFFFIQRSPKAINSNETNEESSFDLESPKNESSIQAPLRLSDVFERKERRQHIQPLLLTSDEEENDHPSNYCAGNDSSYRDILVDITVHKDVEG